MIDMWTPVVLQMGLLGDGPGEHATLDLFMQATEINEFNWANGVLRYTSLMNETFTISSDRFEIEGAPIDLNPAKTYDSPYITGTYGSDLVDLNFPLHAKVTLDFRYESMPTHEQEVRTASELASDIQARIAASSAQPSLIEESTDSVEEGA